MPANTMKNEVSNPYVALRELYSLCWAGVFGLNGFVNSCWNAANDGAGSWVIER